MTKSPVSLKETAQTGWIWASKVATQEALRKSQILIVESPEQVARCDPLGWKSRLATQSLWPSPDIISSPCGNVLIYQVLSSLAVATIDFLGCIDNDVIALLCPLNLFASIKLLALNTSNCKSENGFSLVASGNGVYSDLLVDYLLFDICDLVRLLISSSDSPNSFVILSSRFFFVNSRFEFDFTSFSFSSFRSIFSFIARSYLRSSSVYFFSYWICNPLSLSRFWLRIPFSDWTRLWWILWKSLSFLKRSKVSLKINNNQNSLLMFSCLFLCLAELFVQEWNSFFKFLILHIDIWDLL